MLLASAEWSTQQARDSENVAMLVDRDDFWLTSEYRSWITDPDDPEVKRQRALRKRDGRKPPDQPPLRPVALRPAELDDKRRDEYKARAEPPAPARQDTTEMTARGFAALLNM